MNALLDLYWREPWWLGLVAVPLLLGGWKRLRRARALRYADAELLPWAVSQPGRRASGSGLRSLAHGLAWLLLALAAAGPRAPLDLREGLLTPRHVMTVIVLLDVSASMHATDIVPDRLTRARLELLDWLPRLQGERVGLIVYAGEAGVLLPPTDDIALLQRAIDQIDPRLIEAQGSNLTAALDLARAQLTVAPGKSKAVLLLTDAEANSTDAATRTAAEALRQAGWPLFVLALGSEAGAPVPLPDGGFAELEGMQVQSRMTVEPYRQWAETSGGQFAEVSDGQDDWSVLHERGLAAWPGDPVASDQAQAWQELYAWCLIPALVLFMAASLPRRVVVLVAVGVLAVGLVPLPAWADETAAWQAWQQKHYGRAQTLYVQVGGYSGQMGAGAAAWRLADYAAAARHFGAALLLAANDVQRADALYNLGNAHYGKGQYPVAIEAYETVLRLRPSDANARTNLGWAVQRMRRTVAETPMKSDLRGRRGMLAEGQISLDGEPGWRREDGEPEPIGVQRDHSIAVSDARAQSGVKTQPPISVNTQLATSGLKKLERLEDRPQQMLRNLLKQDARHDGLERQPW